MKPISLKSSEFKTLMSVVTSESARMIIEHLFHNPKARVNALDKLIGKRCQNVIYSCINREIKDQGFRVVFDKGKYSFVRFGVLCNEIRWRICKKPTGNHVTLWGCRV